MKLEKKIVKIWRLYAAYHSVQLLFAKVEENCVNLNVDGATSKAIAGRGG